MRTAVICPLVMALLVAAPALAGTAVVELDLDGIFGNGPDLWMPANGDSVDVDVILYGDPPPANICSFLISIRATGGVECVRCSYRTPAGWRTALPRNGDAMVLQGMDPTFLSPLPIPAVLATLTLRAGASPSGSGLFIDDSSWYATATGNHIHPAVDGGAIEIDALSSRDASWGVVKDAFR